VLRYLLLEEKETPITRDDGLATGTQLYIVSNNKRGLKLKIIIIWLAILLMGSFWLTMREASDPVSLVAIPQAPREGDPIIATLKLNNPSSQAISTDYQFYANGELLKEGTAIIAPVSSYTCRYAYENPLQMGEQLNFMVKTQSEQGNYEKFISSPSYPPQIWSSFVSFASFSTSLVNSLSFMSTMSYYQSNFNNDTGLNLGLIASIVLIVLLIFLELSGPVVAQGNTIVLGRLRVRLSTLTWMLFIIFMGIVFTKVVMILAL